VSRIKERNLEIMASNVAIVMKSYIHFEGDKEVEIDTLPGSDGYLFIKAAVIPSNEVLDLEAEMLKLGWAWVGVKRH
jgi:hypothetical protein